MAIKVLTPDPGIGAWPAPAGPYSQKKAILVTIIMMGALGSSVPISVAIQGEDIL